MAGARPDTVDRYLRDVDAYRKVPGLEAFVTVVDDVLHVRLRQQFELPFPIPGAKSSTTIEATGSATMPIY